MAVPPVPVKVEIAPAADLSADPSTWTFIDITGDVRTSENIVITRGRRDEGARVDPSELTAKINNRGGVYSPRNVTGPHFGTLARNTPIRVSVPLVGAGQFTLLSDNFERPNTTDGWGFAPTGGLWAKDTAHPEPDGETFINSGAGVLVLDDSDPTRIRDMHQPMPIPSPDLFDGDIVATVVMPQIPTGGSIFVKFGYRGTQWAFIEYRTDDRVFVGFGFGEKTLIFTQSLVPGIFPLLTTDQVHARVRITGDFHQMRVWKNADPEPTDWFAESTHTSGSGGDPLFYLGAYRVLANTDTDPQVHFVDYEVSLEVDKFRFHGFVNEWPQRWDHSGVDAWVPIVANGPLRRLQQGAKALKSTLSREVPKKPDVVAYWPMEDDQDASEFASPLEGVPAIPRSSDMTLATEEVPAGGSGNLPLLQIGALLKGRIQRFTPADGWRVDWLFKMDNEPAPGIQRGAMTVFTSNGTTYRWQVTVGANLDITLANSDYDLLEGTFSQPIHENFYGQWVKFSLRIDEVNNNPRFFIDAFGLDFAFLHSHQKEFTTLTNAGIGRPARLLIGPVGDPERNVGHITISRHKLSNPFDEFAINGYRGELATARLQRLSDEENVPITIVGDLERSEPMGSQGLTTVVDLIHECEDADRGLFGEAGFGFVYQTGHARSNQPAVVDIDQAAGELGEAPEPTDDDQLIRNDITVKRDGGSSLRVVDQASVDRDGRYEDESFELNIAEDDQLPDLAHWRLNLGTVDEPRWPVIPVRLVNPKHAHLIPMILALPLGGRLRMPLGYTQLPGVEVEGLADGWTERLNTEEWAVDLFTVPASPWRLFELEHPDRGRLDTAGSSLTVAVDDIDTSISVSTDVGPVWINSIDHAAMFPMRVMVGGEIWDVTAIAAGSYQEGFEGGISGWTVSVGAGFIAESKDESNSGARSLKVIPDGIPTTVSVDSPFETAATTAPGVQHTGSCWVRAASSAGSIGPDGVRAVLVWYDAGGSIISTSSGTQSTLPIDVWTEFTVTATAPALTARVGFRVEANETAGMHTGDTFYVDDVSTGPQIFTVTRSVNGVIKSHAAGAPVALWPVNHWGM